MKRYLLFIAAAAVLAVILLCTYKKDRTNTYQQEIADNIIRFHVRANSDSDEDQALKMKVKNEVVNYLREEFEDASSLDEARNILYYDRDEIEQLARSVVNEEGYDYKVSAYFDNDYFPMKVYGDLCFPSGTYEAFRIDIGEFEGKNWWCVLYPTLCFVDSCYTIVPEESKEELQMVLSKDAYASLIMDNDEENTYEFRFKYLTFLNKLL